MDKELDAKELEEKINDLALAMRSSDTDKHSNVRSGKNRLERLSNDIQDVFGNLPIQNGLFTFSLIGGNQQRFIIDNEAHVETNSETGDYEFHKETRLGTALLGRTSNRRQMAKLVTRYISEKLLDQQRVLESEFIAMTLARNSSQTTSMDIDEALEDDDDFEFGNSDLVNENEVEEQAVIEPEERIVRVYKMPFFAMLTWFLIGILTAIIAAMVAEANGKLAIVISWFRQLIA